MQEYQKAKLKPVSFKEDLSKMSVKDFPSLGL